MKKTEMKKIKYVLYLNEEELSIMGAALHYSLFENLDFICCESCRAVGIKVLEKTFALFMTHHKHS